MRIVADRDVCIGSGMCALNAPAVFDQDAEEGLVLVLDARPDAAAIGAVREAVSLCPSGALSLVDE